MLKPYRERGVKLASLDKELSSQRKLFAIRGAARKLSAFDSDSHVAQLPCGRIYSEDFLNVIPAIAEGAA